MPASSLPELSCCAAARPKRVKWGILSGPRLTPSASAKPLAQSSAM